MNWKPLFALVMLSCLRPVHVPAAGAPASAPGREPHWAFLPPELPAVPCPKNQRWIRNPIDAFLLDRLERAGMAPAPEADRVTLIRRLHLDLIGLPPAPEQVRAFLADARPDAFAQVVEALLASPHFGERWARHWLDLARYADTSGYQIDRPRPYAHLFRDWVIDSINEDQPFDEFTIEQLAGDLLPEATADQKIAAGFHRLTLMNHEDGVDAEEFRCKAKVDRVSTTGAVWLGLTVGCAECHNHKYDPISQREFYQLYAFFNNADEVEHPLAQALPEQYERERKAWETEQARLKESLAQWTRARDPRAAGAKRSLARHLKARPRGREMAVPTFQESTNAAGAFIHVRGDFLRRGDEVRPGTPAVLPPLHPSGRQPNRLDLARWLVAPGQPLASRVAVNQVWLHLFGRGLVNSPDDFGTRGERPSHPELLDWLAVIFSSPDDRNATPAATRPGPGPGLGWSRKALIRLMVTSSAYRQSSAWRPELAERDPENILLARQNRIRLESEIIRDVSLAVGGFLNDTVGGPSFRPYLPDDVKKLGAAGAFAWEDSPAPDKYRRGLYIFAQRTVPYPTAMTFDQADPTQSCARRERSNTPLQALTLLNHGLFVECAQGLARRMGASPGRTVRQRIQHGFELCLGRSPTRAELDRLEALHRKQTGMDLGNGAELAQFTGHQAASGPAPVEGASLVALAQVLLNLDEFLTRE